MGVKSKKGKRKRMRKLWPAPTWL